jgi:hypothetical protein
VGIATVRGKLEPASLVTDKRCDAGSPAIHAQRMQSDRLAYLTRNHRFLLTRVANGQILPVA